MATWHTYALTQMEVYTDVSNFTNTQLIRRLNLAAKLSKDESLTFMANYTVTSTGSVEDWTISGTPETDSTFLKFVVLRAWCLIYTKKMTLKHEKAGRISDGSSSVDTKGQTSFAPVIENPCEIFNAEYIKQYGDANFSVIYGFANEAYS